MTYVSKKIGHYQSKLPKVHTHIKKNIGSNARQCYRILNRTAYLGGALNLLGHNRLKTKYNYGLNSIKMDCHYLWTIYHHYWIFDAYQS